MPDHPRRTVCVMLVDRANYARLKPIMRAIQQRPVLQLQVVASGTMLLERFGQPVQLVRRDGFSVDGEVYIELEGSTPATMAKSVGFGMVEFASEFQRLRPDVVLLNGDRYEVFSAAAAAAYMNLTIAHLQGGEISGSIDESARHAISRFAHFHFPSTQRAKEYLIRMGEREDRILDIGCPSSDLARTLDRTLDPSVVNERGAGVAIDPSRPFLVSLFHPTTTEYGKELGQIEEFLHALGTLNMPTVLLWPNIDAGSDHISKAIRVFRTQQPRPWLHTITNLPPEDFLRVLANAACAVGNSSSFVRDAGFFGTPVVLVGNRQRFREIDEHVTCVSVEHEAIVGAVQDQLAHGVYEPSILYGDGHVAERIAQHLEELSPYVQKHLAYGRETEDALTHVVAQGQPHQLSPAATAAQEG